MNYWLHRISHHAELSYPLLEKGYLSIGYSDFRHQDFIDRTRSEGWDFFNSAIQEMWGECPRTRYNLWRFVADMAVGDWVIVPSWGVFSIYEIIGDVELVSRIDVDDLQTWNQEPVVLHDDYLTVADRHLDLGFVRRVMPIETSISRYDYADAALTSRMKVRSTNAEVSDLEESIRKALTAHKEKKPINLHSLISKQSKNALLELLRTELNDTKLELLLKWYFEQVGASQVWIPSKNESGKEGDADVVAVFEPLKTVIFVQAKYHEGMTSDWATTQIDDYVKQKNATDDGYAKIGWVVTTADYFSETAEEKAKENSILLFRGQDLAQMVLEAGIENLDKAF